MSGPAEFGRGHIAGRLGQFPFLAEPKFLGDRRGIVGGRLGLERLPHDLPIEGARVIDLRGASAHLSRRRPAAFSVLRFATEKAQPTGV